MEQAITQVTQWLNSHLDHTIIVKKEEDDDIDQVHIQLSQFEFRQTGEGSDAYLDSALVLQGKGSTLNNDGDLVPLPQDMYDIATTGLEIINLVSEEIELHSARAKYTISST
ncbi:hypothetical protein [Paenibacillus antarcticus]|nr:hypothetical protein [Paenibacillus antarcticus]